jgi:hypothetical protein
MATAEVLRAETAPLSYDQVPETKYERRCPLNVLEIVSKLIG